jgi:DNA-binding NtrC family response regulator
MGEMTLRMQGLLLRFLETGELQKVGMERAGRTVNVRVVAATNRQLTEMMDQGLFRRDLFYRLNVIHLEVPPLRQHKEDLPELIDLFLRRFTETGRYAVHAIAPEAIAALTEHTWPGNVRELENTIEQLVVSCRNEVVQVEDLPPTLRRAPTVSLRTKHERRRAVTDDLYRRLVENRESFWTSIYPLFMRREITRSNVRDVVRRGLEDARGNYKIVARLFNVEAHEYKKLLNFLRKHDCQVPFKEYR